MSELLLLPGERGNRAFLRAEKFLLMQGVLSHMAGKEVEGEEETDASRL